MAIELIFKSPQNPNSHKTIKKRRWPSFPTKHLFSSGMLKSRVLDFGCGLGLDVDFLRSQGIQTVGFDPYYYPSYPEERFDTILCNYVLNVLLPEEQAHVLMAISELLRPEGKAYFTVRRDIKRNGFRYNPKQECTVYQCNVVLPYKSVLRSEHCEIYEYRHITEVGQRQNKTCAFCNPQSDNRLLTESATAYSICPVSSHNTGLTLIVPKRHCSDYFDLGLREQSACWLMAGRVKKLLIREYSLSGLKIEFESFTQGSAPEKHTHIKLVPC